MYLEDKYLNTVLENSFIDLMTEAEGFNPGNLAQPDLNSKELDIKSNLFGKMKQAKKIEKNNEEVQSLLSEYNLSHTHNTKYGRLIYTSPDLKLKNINVKFVSSAYPNSRDGYGSIKNANILKCFLWMYKLYDNAEGNRYIDLLELGCKDLYESRNVSIDKNYRFIAEKWLGIKDIYIYITYGQQANMWFVNEVDISRLKGLQDYIAKKSYAVIYSQYNFSSGKLYYGTNISNEGTKAFEYNPV